MNQDLAKNKLLNSKNNSKKTISLLSSSYFLTDAPTVLVLSILGGKRKQANNCGQNTHPESGEKLPEQTCSVVVEKVQPTMPEAT